MSGRDISAHPRLTRSRTDRLVAGVAGGLGHRFGVPVVGVRLAFGVLAFVGGIGVVLYIVAWLVMPEVEPATGDRARSTRWESVVGLAAVLGGILLLLRSAGLLLPDAVVFPAVLVGAGLILVWSRMTPGEDSAADEVVESEWIRRLAPTAREAVVALVGTRRGTQLRVVAGLVFLAAGFITFLAAADALDALGRALVAATAIVLGAALVVGPSVARLARELTEERRSRIRSEERADMAAHLHDSVLQTLAMVQRRADDPKEVVRLARGQERELRAWLVDEPGRQASTLAGALEAECARLEAEVGVPVEVVAVGDAQLDSRSEALVRAATEAVRNAVRHSGASTVSVYSEVGDDRAEVDVRDRGRGFEPDEVADDRRGISESITARMERHGGTARIASVLGEGTEVELVMPRVRAVEVRQ